ncbi:hypothetical protein J8J14_11400 [Roseomonas sp. SSH11]|uniref:Uncharacterized protein n=1 Tax=Pararoseomonas baculiformis TaxID=2820812 RepID=A0ABS4AEF6_9PROT|nr:hypothetical protein [Pararoseomonas baculiformis]MBP0445385.1 hypothetical protein [Pararoseomonas baculiformis]
MTKHLLLACLLAATSALPMTATHVFAQTQPGTAFGAESNQKAREAGRTGLNSGRNPVLGQATGERARQDDRCHDQLEDLLRR